jgi:hypothetical protein
MIDTNIGGHDRAKFGISRSRSAPTLLLHEHDSTIAQGYPPELYIAEFFRASLKAVS